MPAQLEPGYCQLASLQAGDKEQRKKIQALNLSDEQHNDIMKDVWSHLGKVKL